MEWSFGTSPRLFSLDFELLGPGANARTSEVPVDAPFFIFSGHLFSLTVIQITTL